MISGLVIWIPLALSGALWLGIAIRLVGFRRRAVPMYLDANTPAPALTGSPPRVSVLVPAREEQKDIGPCLRSIAAQDLPPGELIVVDDESTDLTAAEARRALSGMPGAIVLDGGPRPDGEMWAGKTWALEQAWHRATGDWLWFSDADVILHPAALRQALQEAGASHADALSLMPVIDCRSAWERMLMPLFATLAALMEPLDRASRSDHSSARLCGAFILMRRDAYEAAGTHRAIRAELLEDMALAGRLKRCGRQVRLLYTHDLVRTRMYDSFGGAWEGLTRFGYPMLKRSPLALTAAIGATVVGAWVPWMGLGVGTAALASGRIAGLGPALVSAGLIAVAPWAMTDCCRLLRVPRLYALLLPFSAGFITAAAAWSAFCHHTGRHVPWKGRACSLSGQG